MNKSDLKTGMVVEIDKGIKFLVLLNTAFGNIGISKEVGMSDVDGFNDQFIYSGYDPIKIMRIYSPKYGNQMSFNNWDEMKLIWERKPDIKELTLQEIADKFGIEASQLRIKESEATNGNSK